MTRSYKSSDWPSSPSRSNSTISALKTDWYLWEMWASPRRTQLSKFNLRAVTSGLEPFGTHSNKGLSLGLTQGLTSNSEMLCSQGLVEQASWTSRLYLIPSWGTESPSSPAGSPTCLTCAIHYTDRELTTRIPRKSNLPTYSQQLCVSSFKMRVKLRPGSCRHLRAPWT